MEYLKSQFSKLPDASSSFAEAPSSSIREDHFATATENCDAQLLSVFWRSYGFFECFFDNGKTLSDLFAFLEKQGGFLILSSNDCSHLLLMMTNLSRLVVRPLFIVEFVSNFEH